MPQANSVQREPSMEEILASIRRIIEDSDTARKVLDEEEEAAARADIRPALPAAGEVEAFREGLTADQPAMPVGPAPIEVKAAGEPRFEQEPLGEEWSHSASAVAEPEPEARKQEETSVKADDRDFNGADFSAAAEQSAAHWEDENPRPPILSEHAGRQVAASFGELSEAFAASRRRSFDELAEEMMRPMLQDWLDNNLPLLVERLVREEIERVARGGAR